VPESDGGGPRRWRLGEAIGSGSFGRVFKALDESTGRILAVKRLRVDATLNAAQLGEIEREVSLLRGLSHRNIVHYVGTERRASRLFIFLEYCGGGSLSTLLAEFGPLPDATIRRYTRDIVQGIRYLHGRRIVHRDVKGANVLVAGDGTAKLADFGCSKRVKLDAAARTLRLDESLRALRGSIPWMAPEVVRQTGHGRKADIWSVGATVLEMATAKHPWPEFENNFSALFHVATADAPPPVPDGVTVPVRGFLACCFKMDPDDRATAEELLAHSFLGSTVEGSHDGHASHRNGTGNRRASSRSSQSCAATSSCLGAPTIEITSPAATPAVTPDTVRPRPNFVAGVGVETEDGPDNLCADGAEVLREEAENNVTGTNTSEPMTLPIHALGLFSPNVDEGDAPAGFV
jgi:mitogen-activated protein kinase kinase kinase